MDIAIDLEYISVRFECSEELACKGIDGFKKVINYPQEDRELFGYEGNIAIWLDFARKYQDKIKVREIDADTIKPEDLSEICEQYTDLEALVLRKTVLNKNQLDHIGLLTNLKTLKLLIKQNAWQDITFLANLEALEILKFESAGSPGSTGGYNWINFEMDFHNLKTLELENFAQSRTNYPPRDFTNWFMPFKNIEKVTFKDYYVMHWPDFLYNISTLEKLHTLELVNVGTYKEAPPKSDVQIVLKLDGCMMQQEDLDQFLACCPMLEQKEINNIWNHI